jgi:hypothetical protein
MECDSQQQATESSEEAKLITQVEQETYQQLDQSHLHHHHHHHRQAGDRSDLGPAEKKMKASDFAEYDMLINELADLLKLARHQDSAVVLKAARLLLETTTSNKQRTAAAAAPPSPPQATAATTTQTGDDNTNPVRQTCSLGNDTKTRASGCSNRDGSSRLSDDKIRTIQQSKFTLDDVLLPKTLVTKSAPKTSVSEVVKEEKYDLTKAFERAAKALKLLYLDDQRQLQNQVNELISSVQSITANPKTDPRLLATGR